MKAGVSANLDSVRTTRKALLLIASMYVLIGFALAVYSIMRRDPLGAFLGFAIVIGTISAAVMLGYVLKLIVRSELLARQVEELACGVGRVERLAAIQLEAQEHRAGTIRQVDLSGVGAGDPTLLAAATLDRAVYPRLVRTMEEEPPAASAAAAAEPVKLRLAAAGDAGAIVERRTSDGFKNSQPNSADANHGRGGGGQRPASANDADGSPPSDPSASGPGLDLPLNGASAGEGNAAGPSTKNLLAQWRTALRSDDLATCRAVYSALVDTAAAEQLAPLAEQLHFLADRVEGKLRDRFVRCVRERDYSAALAAGEEICRLLADRPVVEEFERLRPRLLQRLSPEPSQSASTPVG